MQSLFWIELTLCLIYKGFLVSIFWNIYKQIIEDLESEELSIAKISRKYSWSKSAIYNIRKQKYYYLYGESKKHFSKISCYESGSLVRHIYDYLNKHSYPLYVKDFQHLAEAKQSKTYPQHIIRDIMIKDAGLTYKRINSRPLGYSNEIIKEARILFCVKFSQNLTTDTLILNIDECSIGRGWHAEYSWSKRGYNQERQNACISGSLKIILAIASNGWWFVLFTQSNINAK